jgi:hypothetical protein
MFDILLNAMLDFKVDYMTLHSVTVYTLKIKSKYGSEI